jgi:hypothetical protein
MDRGFKWEKLGRVFNPREHPGRNWMFEFAQAPSVLVFDDFIRVYFSCRPKPNDNGQYVSYSAYVDLNRKNLFEIINVADEPVMPLGEPGAFDEFGTYPMSVIRNGNVIMCYYGGWTRCESVPFNVAIGAAVSYDDGRSFKKLGPGPVLSYSPDEPFILSGPKIRRYNDRWYLFYIAGKKWLTHNGRAEPVYQVRMAESQDGLAWKKHNRDIIKTKLEENECQASPDVFFYENRYHMFFSYRYSVDYRGKEKGYRLGYAFSDNLIDWTRDDSKVGIDVSEQGWDSEMISYSHVFELDGEIYILYLGNEVGRYGFGLAKMIT